MKELTHTDMRKALRQFVAQYGSQNKGARALEISAQYLGDMLKGARPVSLAVVHRLGYEKHVIYREIAR